MTASLRAIADRDPHPNKTSRLLARQRPDGHFLLTELPAPQAELWVRSCRLFGLKPAGVRVPPRQVPQGDDLRVLKHALKVAASWPAWLHRRRMARLEDRVREAGYRSTGLEQGLRDALALFLDNPQHAELPLVFLPLDPWTRRPGRDTGQAVCELCDQADTTREDVRVSLAAAYGWILSRGAQREGARDVLKALWRLRATLHAQVPEPLARDLIAYVREATPV